MGQSMPQRINLDTDNITVKELFEQAATWQETAPDLTIDQAAILALKRVVELKDQAGDLGGGKECFICATGS